LYLGVGEDSSGFVLKLFLDQEELERLYDFEEECMEGLVREKELKLRQSTDERVRIIGKRIDVVGSTLVNVHLTSSRQREDLHSIDLRLTKVEETSEMINNSMASINKLLQSETACQAPKPVSLQNTVISEEFVRCIDFNVVLNEWNLTSTSF
jgi:transient receptor potential cation channel subfamily M protein 3